MTHNSDSGYSDPYNTFTSTTFCQRKKSRLYPEEKIDKRVKEIVWEKDETLINSHEMNLI